jgi:hypothetical protein
MWFILFIKQVQNQLSEFVQFMQVIKQIQISWRFLVKQVQNSSRELYSNAHFRASSEPFQGNCLVCELWSKFRISLRVLCGVSLKQIVIINSAFTRYVIVKNLTRISMTHLPVRCTVFILYVIAVVVFRNCNFFNIYVPFTQIYKSPIH